MGVQKSYDFATYWKLSFFLSIEYLIKKVIHTLLDGITGVVPEPNLGDYIFYENIHATTKAIYIRRRPRCFSGRVGH